MRPRWPYILDLITDSLNLDFPVAELTMAVAISGGRMDTILKDNCGFGFFNEVVRVLSLRCAGMYFV